MSHATMFVAPIEGPFDHFADFPNAWGAAAYVWTQISRKLFANEAHWLMSAGRDGGAAFWKAIEDPRLTDFERACFAFTFDRAVLWREDFAKMAIDMRKFVEAHPPGTAVCHLPAIATFLESFAAEDDSPHHYVAFRQTSVSANQWRVYADKDDDEGRMYDPSKEENHFSVYE